MVDLLINFWSIMKVKTENKIIITIHEVKQNTSLLDLLDYLLSKAIELTFH